MVFNASGGNFKISSTEKWKNADGSIVHGTIRSARCKVIGLSDRAPFTCETCTKFVHSAVFNKAAHRAHEKREAPLKTSKYTRVDYLGPERAKQARQQLNADHQAKIRALSKPKLNHIGPVLNLLLDNLRSKGEKHGFAHIENMIKNSFVRGPNGQRYDPSTRAFWVLLEAIAGPSVTEIVSRNLLGPARSTIKKWKRSSHHFENWARSNFRYAREIYLAEFARLGLTGQRVVVQLAEDETRVQDGLEYDPRTDSIFGACGVECHHCSSKKCACNSRHKCRPDFTVKLDDKLMAEVIELAPKLRRATYARLVMVNPLHPELRPLPVAWVPTCLTFDADDVRKQWRQLEEWFQDELGDLFYLIGHSSDGDPRRRKAMISAYSSASAADYGLATANFQLWAKPTLNSEGRISKITGIHDQDWVHVGRKFINSSRRASRNLFIGKLGSAFLHHLDAVFEVFPPAKHGLRQGDQHRRGYLASDTRSMMRTVSPKCLACLEELSETTKHQRHGAELRPLLRLLKILRRYLSIFMSRQTIRQRVQSAGFVFTYVWAWRAWVIGSGNLTIRDNFLSRETLIDLSISCHAVVNTIRAARDLCPNIPLDLLRMGTYGLETFFSQMGGMKGNHRVFGILAGLRLIQAHMRASECRSSEDVVMPARGKDLSQYWEENTPTAGANAMQTLSDDELRLVWELGVEEALSLAAEDGMETNLTQCSSELANSLQQYEVALDAEHESDDDSPVPIPLLFEHDESDLVRHWMTSPGSGCAIEFGELLNALLGLQIEFRCYEWNADTHTLYKQSPVKRRCDGRVLMGKFVDKYVLLLDPDKDTRRRTPSLVAGKWRGNLEINGQLKSLEDDWSSMKEWHGVRAIVTHLGLDVERKASSNWVVPLLGVLCSCFIDAQGIIERLHPPNKHVPILVQEAMFSEKLAESGIRKIVTPHFDTPDGKIHKASLIASLNSGEAVSADRIRRYQVTEPKPSQSHKFGPWLVSKWSNVAIKYDGQDPSEGAVRLKGHPKWCSWLGCIVAIQRKYGGRWCHHYQSVNLDTQRKEPFRFYCYLYNRIDGLQFQYATSEAAPIPISAIISPVDLEHIQGDEFKLRDTDLEIVEAALGGKTTWNVDETGMDPVPQKRQKTDTRSKSNATQSAVKRKCRSRAQKPKQHTPTSQHALLPFELSSLPNNPAIPWIDNNCLAMSLLVAVMKFCTGFRVELASTNHPRSQALSTLLSEATDFVAKPCQNTATSDWRRWAKSKLYPHLQHGATTYCSTLTGHADFKSDFVYGGYCDGSMGWASLLVGTSLWLPYLRKERCRLCDNKQDQYETLCTFGADSERLNDFCSRYGRPSDVGTSISIQQYVDACLGPSDEKQEDRSMAIGGFGVCRSCPKDLQAQRTAIGMGSVYVAPSSFFVNFATTASSLRVDRVESQLHVFEVITKGYAVYKPFAFLYHVAGHYVCDVWCEFSHKWLHYDGLPFSRSGHLCWPTSFIEIGWPLCQEGPAVELIPQGREIACRIRGWATHAQAIGTLRQVWYVRASRFAQVSHRFAVPDAGSPSWCR